MADENMEETTTKANGTTTDDSDDESKDQMNGAVEDIREISEVIAKAEEKSAVEKYWSVVKEHPEDFASWTYLLQHAEQLDQLKELRHAYDSFLKLYPYCYGYWKKYADAEKKRDDMDMAEKVYERGVTAIPLSIDLWIHYINFYKEVLLSKDIGDETELLRGLYERAVVGCGRDFRSDKLWDLYIAFETENGELRKVMAIYDRLLSTPTLLYSSNFDKFKEFVENNIISDILVEQEYLECIDHLKATKEKKKLTQDVDQEELDDIDPDEFYKKYIVDKREKVHKKNMEEIGKRWNYEDGIKRPYFHVKPLERAQLKNWNDYLDFEMKVGNRERIVLLFERCVIACALYEQFWIKYAKYLGNKEAARAIYKRACLIHLPKKPVLHLAYSAFEESLGDHDKALDILVNLEQAVPGLMEITLRRINLERRRGNHEAVQQLFGHCIENAPSDKFRTNFSLKYARYQFKVMGDRDKAVEVLRNAMSKDKANTQLYMQLIDIGYQSNPPDQGFILEVFDKAISSADLSEHDKAVFSMRRIEFLEDFGTDVKTLVKHTDSHVTLLENSTELKKRLATDSVGGGPSEKKAKTDADAYANSSSNQSYNYSNQASWQNYQNAYNYQQSWNQYQNYYQSS